jgi:hypothetical protein
MPYDQLPTPSGVHCVRCGYDLTGAVIGSVCPECGAPVAPSFQRRGQAVSGLAVTSMVLGITGLPLCACYGLPTLVLGPLAILFWFLARSQIRGGEVSEGSAGMATAGLVCGIIGCVIAYGGWGAMIVIIVLDQVQ